MRFLIYCSKIIFDKKLFSYCCNEFDCQRPIVYSLFVIMTEPDKDPIFWSRFCTCFCIHYSSNPFYATLVFPRIVWTTNVFVPMKRKLLYSSCFFSLVAVQCIEEAYKLEDKSHVSINSTPLLQIFQNRNFQVRFISAGCINHQIIKF